MITCWLFMEYFPPHADNPQSGQYIVRSPNETVLITNDQEEIPVNNNRALHGDIVTYIINNEIAKVTSIITRPERKIPGVLLTGKTRIIQFNRKGMPVYEFVPVDWRFPHFYVASNIKKGSNNCYILVKYKEWTTQQTHPHGLCLEILGQLADSATETTVALYKNQLYFKPHKEKGIIYDHTCDNRIDLTDKYVFTIDPDGCTDIDDAIHIEQEIGRSIIYVHIADVDSIFPVDNLYEPEIRKRLTTIYTNSKKYHMIPERFASNICSLIPKQIRNVVTACFMYDTHNQLINRSFQLSKIRSSMALTYDQANNILSGNDNTKDVYVVREKLMALSKILQTTDSHKIIEKLMIMTNSFAAEFTGNIFSRTHKHSMIDMEEIELPILKYLTYKYENSAEYSVGNKGIGHQLMGLEHYTHFTSPIRRYADLVVHRLVKDKLLNKSSIYSIEELSKITNELNVYNKHLKKFYRDESLLNMYRKINNEGGSVSTKGYLVDYKIGYVYIYLPKYDLEYKFPLFDNKSDLYKTVIKNNGLCISYKHSLPATETVIPFHQEINIHLTTNNEAIRFQNKVKMLIF